MDEDESPRTTYAWIPNRAGWGSPWKAPAYSPDLQPILTFPSKFSSTLQRRVQQPVYQGPRVNDTCLVGMEMD